MDPELDARRARIADEGLTPAAVAALTPVVTDLPIDALTPVKQLLKRYFSSAPWTPADADALAEVVGPGTGEERFELSPDLVLVWGWTDARFHLDVRDAPGEDGGG